MPLTPVETSSSNSPGSSSSPEAESGPLSPGTSVAESDQTLTVTRKLSLWERFLQKIYSKQEFEAYLLNKERKKKEKESKKKKSASSPVSTTEQTTADPDSGRPDS